MAFEPAPCLLDSPLARPWRRGMAMLVDLIIIAFITTSLEEFIIPILFVLWIYKTNKVQNRINNHLNVKRFILRAISLAIFGWALVNNFNSVTNSNLLQNNGQTLSSAISLAGTAMGSISCTTAICMEPLVDKLLPNIALNGSLEQQKINLETLLNEVASDSQLPGEEVSKLKAMAITKLSKFEKQPDTETGIEDTTFNLDFNDDEPNMDSSPLDWVKGFLNDMGLGFGLAALYFSFFIAWGRGQTPGKSLLNIKVIQLNNSQISLWEAFGRYGGYGAGLATGLLGFFQIYWDSNRQAIHDKIASTVVIDLGLRDKDLKQEIMNTV